MGKKRTDAVKLAKYLKGISASCGFFRWRNFAGFRCNPSQEIYVGYRINDSDPMVFQEKFQLAPEFIKLSGLNLENVTVYADIGEIGADFDFLTGQITGKVLF